MECGVDNSGKKVSPRNRQLLAHFPKVKEFWFLPKLFPGSAPLCWTRRKPSWFVQFFFWSFCGREGCRLDAAGVSVFWEYGSFSLKFGKSKNAFFLIKSSTYSKSCSAHMECSFCNSANFILPETQKILAQCPKVRKFCFSRILSLRMFHWTGRMPYWRTWSFLAKQIFLEKTIKRFNVVYSYKQSFTKNFFW